jgi:hypothetical protein
LVAGFRANCTHRSKTRRREPAGLIGMNSQAIAHMAFLTARFAAAEGSAFIQHRGFLSSCSERATSVGASGTISGFYHPARLHRSRWEPPDPAHGGNSKSASSRLSGPRTLLCALARQFDRNVPRGAHDPWASVRVGAAYDRFQKKNELFRKHGRRLANGRVFGSVAAGGFEFNHLSESRPLSPAG